ncbi:hypothetical protein LAZ67_21002634 [Cordylochernes scorpioides]|uniref:RNA-directed DNA polymerase n=1 Tax=Cordylochernes scorpioides TaxID=51811 RepID=A0ABY6LSM8_9ARAC|nr:hypothetical protein LAZ67_21002634 [Cordylochernes scorpioides]
MPGHRKRRQFKQTDAFTRGMVIGLKRAGWSIRQIAADTHLGASTVHRLWRRWLEQGNVAIYRNVGSTRVTSARVDRRILRQAVAAPQATCTAILQHVQDTLDHSISTRTISRRLVANGLHSCRPLRRLRLTPPNRRQRLEWCRARSTWMTEWHRVVFSDESRFCLSSDSRSVRVRRRRGERSNPAAIVERPTVRQRGIMGVPNALYQQDNARPHTARISQQALQDVQMLPWPPYSPDLSPIEHVWDIIGRRLHALPQPRSEDELWQMVEREWRAIPQDAIRTLIDSIPRRVAACIAVRVYVGNVQHFVWSYRRDLDHSFWSDAPYDSQERLLHMSERVHKQYEFHHYCEWLFYRSMWYRYCLCQYCWTQGRCQQFGCPEHLVRSRYASQCSVCTPNDRKRRKVVFNRSGCQIMDIKGKLLIEGKKLGRLHYVQNTPSSPIDQNDRVSLASECKEELTLELWHNRLYTIAKMVKNQSVRGLDCSLAKPEKCEDCLISKSYRLPFLQHSHKEEKEIMPLDLGGAKYVLTIIDESTRNTSVIFLKNKGGTLGKVKEWIQECEKQTSRKLKRIRTDNGLEFCSKEWDTFCTSVGIVHEHTMTYTPQQNGVAERMNRTLLDLVRSTISGSGLPKASWVELTYTAAYVRNRVLNNHNGESTPYELWTGNKPSLKHIRAIGCQVFVHIPRQVRKFKLERRAVKGNLAGYALRGRGYRVWIPEVNKVVESRDCVFKESDVSRNDSNREVLPSVENYSYGTQREIEEYLVSLLDQEDVIPTEEDSHNEDTVKPSPTRSHPMILRNQRNTQNSIDILSTEVNKGDPTLYKEAIQGPGAEHWLEAIEEELESLKKHKKLKSLATEDFFDKFIKTLWLEKLPQAIQQILIISEEELDKLAVMADRIAELNPKAEIYEADKPENETKMYGKNCLPGKCKMPCEWVNAENSNQHRLFASHKNTGMRFLVDSGADVSIIPFKGKIGTPLNDFKLYAANGTEISTYGTQILSLDLGLRRHFQWPFVIAKTNKGVLGADFLNNFKLILDINRRQLIDGITNLTIKGDICSISEETFSSYRTTSNFSKLLANYPDITRPNVGIMKANHDVKHFIITKGPPVFSRARQLDPKRLNEAKQEFQFMLEHEIIRPSNSQWASPLHLVTKKRRHIKTLWNAPATFQRFIHVVLRGLDFTFPYLDDILVASETCEEHETHLKLVLEKLQNYGLRINIAKSILGVDQLEFLGHWITNGGSQPLPSKVQTILDYKLPTTKRELRTFLENIRPFIPEKFRIQIFHQFHDLNHPGIKATINQLKSKFIWKEIKKDVRKWSQACINCQKKKVTRHTKSQIGTFQEPDERFSVIHIDLIGPLSPSNGKYYCLTCIDRDTSWMEVIPLEYITSESVALAFYNNWVSRFGTPYTIVSDQGRQFTSQVFKDLAAICGMKLLLTTPYHPQSKGKIERFNRTLKTAIKAHNSVKWTDSLPTILLALRAAIREDTDLFKSDQVFLRINRIRKPLEPYYEGPYPVLEKSDNFFTLKIKNREVKISIDRLKPAYILRALDQPASSGDPIIPVSREDPIIPASREDPIIPASREDPIIPASSEDPIGPSSKPQPSKPGMRFELPKETRSGRRIKTPSRYNESIGRDFRHWKGSDNYQKTLPPIACKWILHKKTNAEGQVVRYKARLVAKGFTQQKGIDYEEIYSPVSSFEMTRLLTAIGIENNWFIDQYDVKSAYLYGKLDRLIYMEQPEDFVKPGEEHLYCQLKRSLYGLKQSGRCWNKYLDEWLKKKGFMRNPVDPCVYKLKLNEGMIIFSLYVDDILTLTENQEVREKCIELLRGHFETKYIGPVSYLLGVNFTRSKGGCVTLTQRAYIKSLLERFNLQEGREVSTPMETRPELLEEEDEENCQDLPYRELMGGLLYISQRKKPDIAYAVSQLARYCSKYTRKHWVAAKRILRYLKSSEHLGITYRRTGEQLCVYSDVDWGTNLEDRKSTSGYVVMFAGAPILWRSSKQTVTALSTMEAEYTSLSSSVREVTWISEFLNHLDIPHNMVEPTPVWCDNQAAIAHAKSYISRSKSRLIAIRYHFVREKVDDGVIQLDYVTSGRNLADIFTKPLGKNLHELHRSRLLSGEVIHE